MRIRTIILGALVVVVSFVVATFVIDWLWPAGSLQQNRPVLTAVPPLPPLTGSSTVLTPAAISLNRDPRPARGAGAAQPVGHAAKSGLAAPRQRQAHL